jgi:prepilin-type N-terminal cleavage/methylation domain-containing protein
MGRIKNKKGFSFMEVMVTIAVLSAGILGTLALVVNSIGSAKNSRDSIISSELAQEGIELARNIRDNNLVNNEDVFLGNSFPANSGGASIIDKLSGVIVADGDEKLYLDGGFYVHDDGGTRTKFQRKLIIDYFDNAGNSMVSAASAVRADVYSIVIWGNGWPSTDYSAAGSTRCDSCYAAVKCVCVRDALTGWN